MSAAKRTRKLARALLLLLRMLGIEKLGRALVRGAEVNDCEARQPVHRQSVGVLQPEPRTDFRFAMQCRVPETRPMRSWQEIQEIASRLAEGAGLPPEVQELVTLLHELLGLEGEIRALAMQSRRA